MNNTEYLSRFQTLVLQAAELTEQIDALQKGDDTEEEQSFTPEIPGVQPQRIFEETVPRNEPGGGNAQ